MELLSYVGMSSLVVGFGYLAYWLIKQIKWRNPIKRYIKKVVLDYLRDLQND